MFLRWIEETRKKPKAVRNQYAFVGASIITGCIAFIWMLSLPTQFANVENGDQEFTESKSAFGKFFSDTKQNFATVLQNRDADESVEATTTEETDSVMVPALRSETIKDTQDEYAESLLPEPRKVLIATTSVEHKKDDEEE